MGQVIYIGSLKEYFDLEKKKTEDPGKYKKIEIIYDLNQIRKERDKMTDQEKKNEKVFSKEEAKVNKFMAEHKDVTYREAVLACLDSSEGLPETKKEFNELTKDEILRAKRNIDNIVYDLSQAKTSEAFNEGDQKLLDSAYSNVQEVAKNLQVVIDKQD